MNKGLLALSLVALIGGAIFFLGFKKREEKLPASPELENWVIKITRVED